MASIQYEARPINTTHNNSQWFQHPQNPAHLLPATAAKQVGFAPDNYHVMSRSGGRRRPTRLQTSPLAMEIPVAISPARVRSVVPLWHLLLHAVSYAVHRGVFGAHSLGAKIPVLEPGRGARKVHQQQTSCSIARGGATTVALRTFAGIGNQKSGLHSKPSKSLNFARRMDIPSPKISTSEVSFWLERYVYPCSTGACCLAVPARDRSRRRDRECYRIVECLLQTLRA